MRHHVHTKEQCAYAIKGNKDFKATVPAAPLLQCRQIEQIYSWQKDQVRRHAVFDRRCHHPEERKRDNRAVREDFFIARALHKFAAGCRIQDADYHEIKCEQEPEPKEIEGIPEHHRSDAEEQHLENVTNVYFFHHSTTVPRSRPSQSSGETTSSLSSVEAGCFPTTICLFTSDSSLS